MLSTADPRPGGGGRAVQPWPGLGTAPLNKLNNNTKITSNNSVTAPPPGAGGGQIVVLRIEATPLLTTGREEHGGMSVTALRDKATVLQDDVSSSKALR